MAARKNNEELRQQALDTLAAGRAEISAEMHRLRLQLNPTRVMHRVVDRHTGLAVCIAFAAGLIPVLLIFRRTRAGHLNQRSMTIHAVRPEPKPMIVTHLLGVLARTVTPALVKSIILSPLLSFLGHKQDAASESSAQD